MERILFALAGTVTIVSVSLSQLLTPWLLLLTLAVGLNQLMFVMIGACPASVVLHKLGVRGAACARADQTTGARR